MLETVPNRGVMLSTRAPAYPLHGPCSAVRVAAGGGVFLMTVDTGVAGAVITVNADPPQRHLGVAEGLRGTALEGLAASEDTHAI